MVSIKYLAISLSSVYFFLLLIEPDIGMPEKDAHRFFKELIAGVVSAIRDNCNFTAIQHHCIKTHLVAVV